MNTNNSFRNKVTNKLFSYKSNIYIYIYIIRVLVITESVSGYVSNQEQYNMESAQYLG